VEGADLKIWRRSERQRLLVLRTGVPPAERRLWGQGIETRLRLLLQERPGIMLGVYWPFQAEFDPRTLIDWLIATGSAVALPAVVDKKGPLEYRAWRPGEKLVDGVWNIPIPGRDPAGSAGATGRFRPALLSARLWGRLFRSHPRGAGAAAMGDRRRFRAIASRNDLPAGFRHSNGSDRHRSRRAPTLTAQGIKPACCCRI